MQLEFEYLSLLHLGYKLPPKKWQVRLQHDKTLVEQKKLQIQEEIKDKMCLIVDVPKPGFGNTNDGNTNRQFFEDPLLASEITGLDSQLIYCLKVI